MQGGRKRYIPARAGEATRGYGLPGQARVHPRACGGSGPGRRPTSRSPGTSPRVRGKHVKLVGRGRTRGYIPARAGEATTKPIPTPATWVHPRACGGSAVRGENTQDTTGTSPRVRGKPGKAAARVLRQRYIPARAGEARPAPAPTRQPTVHPRACGGSFSAGNIRRVTEGTSPRVRGKRASVRYRGMDCGYIPARAGEARNADTTTGVTGVHPRACGGSATKGPFDGVKTGTSPRVRGKRGKRTISTPGDRYIPARAGEACDSVRYGISRRVHPRACGGSAMLAAAAAGAYGTSPRVRGKLPRHRDRRKTAGYIPARAGEALGDVPKPRQFQVHPRACGGSGQSRHRRRPDQGTSPRVRGKPRRRASKRSRRWYIPARAGEAARRQRSALISRVHPRACGGSRAPVNDRSHHPGTSPRVRGKRALPPDVHDDAGYIPARAGEAPPCRPSPPRLQVHPRACGGSTLWRATRELTTGTSPRVRGKLPKSLRLLAAKRYIPARAGEATTAAADAQSGTVHPRACGGSRKVWDARWRTHGTSPRVRGKPVTSPAPSA